MAVLNHNRSMLYLIFRISKYEMCINGWSILLSLPIIFNFFFTIFAFYKALIKLSLNILIHIATALLAYLKLLCLLIAMCVAK